jgi:hypothetical protein
MKTIDWLIYSERNSRFRGCDRLRGLCGRVFAIAIVFGSTQMLFAQHARDGRDASATAKIARGAAEPRTGDI